MIPTDTTLQAEWDAFQQATLTIYEHECFQAHRPCRWHFGHYQRFLLDKACSNLCKVQVIPRFNHNFKILYLGLPVVLNHQANSLICLESGYP